VHHKVTLAQVKIRGAHYEDLWHFYLRSVLAGIVILIHCAIVHADEVKTSALITDDLRCEYTVNPLGIDEPAPRLSWIVESTARAEKQTAYEIAVASTPQLLTGGKADLWRSGRVISDETSQIVYGGKPLVSRQRCYWSVRAWDRDGNAGPWSTPAWWEMGLLQKQDWSASWIDCEPIPLDSPGKMKIKIIQASYETTDGKMARDVTDVLKKSLASGRGMIRIAVENSAMGFDPARGQVKQLHVEYEYRGQKIEVTTAEHETLAIDESCVPYLRKTFSVGKAIRSARLYATALGVYELHLNGTKVGDQLLTPGWTDYNKRADYQVYDVADLLKIGDNAIGAMVGEGWYSGHIGDGHFQYWGTAPRLLAQLEINYADGSTARVVTDGSWQVRPGPIISNDLMKGEAYDARREISAWDQSGGGEAGWMAAIVCDERQRLFCAAISPPVRETAEINPQKMSEPVVGHYVFDLGQNMVGIVRIKVKETAGTNITIRHAEMLNPDGTIYTANLRSATATDSYICKGEGVEIWQPRFTFHGFRYVELTGLAKRPGMDAVTGIVIGSDNQAAGTFSCSDTRVNQLQSNIQWGERGNYLSVPTDCPQRDERLGWMADSQVFMRTGTFNSDVAAFFSKWLVDVDDDQFADGRFTNVSPDCLDEGGVPGWGDAGVICPWIMYQVYGDKRILDRHLDAMARWIDWSKSHSTNFIRDKDRGHDYGDWLSINADTPKDLIGTAYFTYSTHLVAESARVLGKTELANKYDQIFNQIRNAFDRRYLSRDGHLMGNTQTDYLLALKFDLLPENLRGAAAKYLEDDIHSKGWHLSTGFLGVGYLLPVLTESGKVDVAYRLLFQDKYPSWLFPVTQGATTIWERWDGWTPWNGFQTPGMNSFNHYSLGSCGEWLFESCGGIAGDPLEPGFKHIIIHPHPGYGMTWAATSFNCIHGRIMTRWKLQNNSLTLDVTIPANTTADVYILASNEKKVLESGKPAMEERAVTFLRQEGNEAVFKIGSGNYSFASIPAQ
jgi:Bacterial alpha-L-rhamnosidase 6 hairpin glycosidase domain/Alpha-L-rhamnosidase N-terminal domain/Bacterial alpha-L-rhamnosidase concanavalin-like domain/Bacterial alpha-L-rhamnosidase C-terminal domain